MSRWNLVGCVVLGTLCGNLLGACSDDTGSNQDVGPGKDLSPAGDTAAVDTGAGQPDNAIDLTTPDGATVCNSQKPHGGTFSLKDGEYAFAIDKALLNSCETSHGKGIHVVVGKVDKLPLTTKGSCVYSSELYGTKAQGPRSGDSFVMDGAVDWTITGTNCTLRVVVHLTGTLTGDNKFNYVQEATFSSSDPNCKPYIGDKPGALIPSSPCQQKFSGRGWKK